MEVILDLLTLQLESLESKNSELALLYGQPQQSFLAMMFSPGTDASRSSTPVSKLINETSLQSPELSPTLQFSSLGVLPKKFLMQHAVLV